MPSGPRATCTRSSTARLPPYARYAGSCSSTAAWRARGSRSPATGSAGAPRTAGARTSPSGTASWRPTPPSADLHGHLHRGVDRAVVLERAGLRERLGEAEALLGRGRGTGAARGRHVVADAALGPLPGHLAALLDRHRPGRERIVLDRDGLGRPRLRRDDGDSGGERRGDGSDGQLAQHFGGSVMLSQLPTGTPA